MQLAANNAEQIGPVIPLAELLGAFSYALDLTEGQPAGHCIRACWIATHVGQAIGLGGVQLDELYYTTLLKDLGCSSNAARIAQIYLTDDLVLKRDFKLVGTGSRDILAFVLGQTGRAAPLRKRIAALANILRNGSELVREVIETRCTRGAEIARRLRFSDDVAAGIYSLDEHWDGSGQPQRLRGNAIPLYARIALLAQIADVFRTSAGPKAAIAEVRRRSGTWFDPELVAAFETVAREPVFWDDLASPTIETKLASLPPGQRRIVADESFLDEIALAFGSVVDAKSPYTGGHSYRVADYVDALSAQLAVPSGRRAWLRRGALLHDIGKLGISNALLDKPGPLSDAEWAVMRSHAAHTQEILGRVSCLADLAPVAAAHHERLDGTGYPLGLDDARISKETRMITICDFFDALTADRPYRKALPIDTALEIIAGQVGSAVDPDCYAALRATVG
jgi:HD-GYP domain-containing protein (c-di-GMP phosphodiesterase class II)